MGYYYSKIVNEDFDKVIEKVTGELKKEGFGVLSDIDMQGALKKKLNVDYKKYRILGACNPQFAYKALQSEDKIGTMLPCNVIVQEHEDGKVEVSAVNPEASMMGVKNESLAGISGEVGVMLQRVINNL